MLINLRNALMSGKKSPLPPGARWVEYLQSTGTQWADYHGHMAYGDNFHFDIMIDTLAYYSGYVGGYTLGGIRSGQRAYGLGWYRNPAYHWLFCYMTDASSYTAFPTPVINTRYSIDTFVERNNMKMVVNAVAYVDAANNQEVTCPLALFGRASSFSGDEVTAINACSKSRIYELKHFRGGALIKHLRPIAIGTTGYFLDLVSGEYLPYGNKGTGDFVLGPDKN